MTTGTHAYMANPITLLHVTATVRTLVAEVPPDLESGQRARASDPVEEGDGRQRGHHGQADKAERDCAEGFLRGKKRRGGIGLWNRHYCHRFKST